MSINFILEPFETSITLNAGATLFGRSFELISDATADLYVDVALFRNAFQFQTDASDVIDASSTDIKFFVDRQAFWTYNISYGVDINPADAILTVNPILSAPTTNKMMVCHDFTRYLAVKLFNTAHGVDLFDNELAVLTDIRDKSRKCWYKIDSVLIKYDTLYHDNNYIDIYNSENTNINLGTTFVPVSYQPSAGEYNVSTGLYNNKYYSVYSADDTNTSNPCKLLFDQISALKPERFRNISNNDTVQPLPFIENDTISFKLVINPASNQHLLTALPNSINARTYKIRYVLKNKSFIDTNTYERNLTGAGLSENNNFRAFVGQYGARSKTEPPEIGGWWGGSATVIP
jgi:hypothetical protein